MIWCQSKEMKQKKNQPKGDLSRLLAALVYTPEFQRAQVCLTLLINL